MMIRIRKTLRRLHPGRRGSVLVLVVALLVLLALVGTAYLSTTRIDRVAAVQYESAVRLDLLLKGWMNTVRSVVVDDLFDQDGNFRPSTNAREPRADRVYENFDSFHVTRDSITGQPTVIRHGDEWLSPRTPWLDNPYAPADSVSGVPNYPIWAAIGGPLTDTRYATPYIDPANSSPNITRLDGLFTRRTNPIISSINLVQDGAGTVSFPALQFIDTATNRRVKVIAADADGDGIADSMFEFLTEINGISYYGAYRIVDHGSAINVNTAQSSTFDFAGNGTLRSDNLALRADNWLHVTGFFPSHIGLYETLPSYTAPNAGSRLDTLSTELTELNNWRYGFDWTSGGGGVRAQGIDGNPSPAHAVLSEPSYGSFVRQDLRFNSAGEALWINLGRRMENPSANFGPPVSTLTPYRATDVSASVALAYRGHVVLNPSASKTELESRMTLATETGAGGTLTSARTRAFLPETVDRWYNLNYSFDRETPRGNPFAELWVHRRALLTASNAASSAAPVAASGTVADAIPGPIARYAGTPTVNPVSGAQIAPNNRHEVDRTADPNFPVLGGVLNDIRTRPTAKADLNNATFGELWRAFWSVMSEPAVVTGAGTLLAGFTGLGDHAGTPFSDYIAVDRVARGNVDIFDPYVGSRFEYFPVSPPRAATEFPPEISNFWLNRFPASGWHPARMFRSPLRGVPETPAQPFSASTFRMPADQVLLLRSAIAAVNLEQLRRRDDNLVVRNLVGYPPGGGAGFEPEGNSLMVYGRPRGGPVNVPQPVTVRIFGVGRQPFLTEVYAHSDTQTEYGGAGGPNPNGYLALEFYNPYPVPIDLRYARIFRLNRRADGPYHNGSPPGLIVEDMSDFPVTPIVLDPADTNGPTSNVQDDVYGVNSANQLIVPPHGWLVLENYSAAGTGNASAALARPSSVNLAGLTAGPNGNQGEILPSEMPRANFVYVPNLHLLFDHEFVLARWPTADSTVNYSWIQADYIGSGTATRTMTGIRYDPPPVAVRQPGNPALPGGGTPATLYGPPTPRDFAPLDAYDLTGIAPVNTAGFTFATAWHYHRPSSDDKMWRFVYPGRYDGSQPWVGTPAVPIGEPAFPRQQGTRQFSAPVGPQSPDEDPWTPGATVYEGNPGVNLGHDGTIPGDVGTSPERVLGRQDASYAWSDGLALKGEFTIPLRSLAAEQTWPGVNPPGQLPQERYPYGGFARLLDVLQVTYIGSYWVQHHEDWFSNNLNDVVRMIEVNPITMDAAFADDTDTLTDPTVSTLNWAIDGSNVPGGNDPAQSADGRYNSREQLGRFAPLRPSLANGDGLDAQATYPATLHAAYPIGQVGAAAARYGDYFDAANDRDAWRYQWAKRVAEHFTVQSPEDDTLGQGSAQAFWPAPGSPFSALFPLMSVSNDVAGGGVTKAAWARVISSAGSQIEVTTIPTWVTAGSYITFFGADGSPSVGPRNAHYGQRCLVTGVTFLGTTPPRARINYVQTGNDPAPWDNNDPIPLGTVIRIEGRVEGPQGVEGLININTAPARVLAAIPWFPPEDGGSTPWSTGRVSWDAVNKRLLPVANSVDDNWELAQAIVWWRDRDDGSRAPGDPPVPGGPFTSIFDLYKVPAFRVAQAQLLNTGRPGAIAPLLTPPTDPSNERDVGLFEGDFTYPLLWTDNSSPGAPRERYTDGIRFDFKEQFLLLNRVSNLITTRSDLFTVYVVIQGWRDVGLANRPPQFVAERRDAILVDRNIITPNNRKMREFKVTTE